jgi:hypothetical protein
VALAECCLFAPRTCGFELTAKLDAPALFGEPGALIVVSVKAADRNRFEQTLAAHPRVPVKELGRVTAGGFKVDGAELPLKDLSSARNTDPYRR